MKRVVDLSAVEHLLMSLADDMEFRARFLRELSLREIEEGRFSPYVDGQAYAFSESGEDIKKVIEKVKWLDE